MCNNFVAFGGGVGLVTLHHARGAVDVVEQEGQEGDVVLLRKHSVGLRELLDVVGTVVGGEGDSGEGDLDAGLLKRGDDLVEVGAGVFDAEAAEAVVATELDDGDGGVKGENFGEAGDAVLGGVAGDAEIDDAVGEAVLVEIGLEEVGVRVAGVGAIAGG